MIPLFFILLIAAVPQHALPIPVCDLCTGVVVQIQRAPTSLVLCSEPICHNISSDVLTMVNDPFYKQLRFTPEEVCVELNYCKESSLSLTSVSTKTILLERLLEPMDIWEL
jgi:hypothetical protein